MNHGTRSDSKIAAQQLCFPNLPLAVYREIAAHLRQLTGVEVELLPQTAQTFEYQQSQLGGLAIRYLDTAEPDMQRRVQQILAYYGDRYGDWQSLS